MNINKDVLVGISISLLVHAGLALGGELFKSGVKVSVAESVEEPTMTLQAPPVEPEEVEVEEVSDSSAPAEVQSFAPPSLVDMPQAVTFADFTQTLAPPPLNVQVSTVMTIPSGIPATQPGVAKRLAELFRIEDLDTVPRLVQKGRLSYPPDLKRARVMGVVTLRVIIDASGQVSVDGVVDSSHKDFVAAAEDFARQCRFQSPTRNGQPVRASYTWPIQFIP